MLLVVVVVVVVVVVGVVLELVVALMAKVSGDGWLSAFAFVVAFDGGVNGVVGKLLLLVAMSILVVVKVVGDGWLSAVASGVVGGVVIVVGVSLMSNVIGDG